MDRYHRQTLLPGIGREGQERLGESHALLVGCGALGTVIADSLVRAGIGRITIVDRDIVEMTNLQRQILFDEDDVRHAMPKAEAARRRLSRINSHVAIDAHVEDFNSRNAESFLQNVNIILDGLDNFETRYLLNDLAIKHVIPYLYGGAVGTTGMSMAVLPEPARRSNASDPVVTEQHSTGTSPCLRCMFPEPPPPGSAETCDTAGVLGPAPMTIAAHQSAQAIKVLTGNDDAVDRTLVSIDLWKNEVRRFDIASARNPACICCVQRRFEFLDRPQAGGAVALCGRDAVQITRTGGAIDLDTIAKRLAPHGTFTCDKLLMRGTLESERGEQGTPIELILFTNGRAIIRGTERPELARSIYARYIGL